MSQCPHCVLRSVCVLSVLTEATELQTQPIPRDMSESVEWSGHASLRQSLLSGTKVVIADVFISRNSLFFGWGSSQSVSSSAEESVIVFNRLSVEQSLQLNRIRIQRFKPALYIHERVMLLIKALSFPNHLIIHLLVICYWLQVSRNILER